MEDRIYNYLGDKLFYRVIYAFWTVVALLLLFGVYKLATNPDIDWAKHLEFAANMQNPMYRQQMMMERMGKGAKTEL